jgi:hypothetical protein
MTRTTSHTKTNAGPEGAETLSSLTATLREQIIEAQALLQAGDIRGAEARGKATLQLIRAVEAQVRLEDSQTQEERKGVFYDADAIAAARAELTRRFDRLAKTLNASEMDGGAQ